MNCVFCKQLSDDAKSVEHIIPNSLGNTEHTLAKGVICDKCNLYFGNKIERPLLELPYFVNVRNRHSIKSKKGKIPKKETDENDKLLLAKAVSITKKPVAFNIHRSKDGVYIDLYKNDVATFFNSIQTITVVSPVTEYPFLNHLPPQNEILISRLLGKIGIEALAKVGEGIEGGFTEVVNDVRLNPLIQYVRYGQGVKFWEYTCRPLYAEHRVHSSTEIDENFQVLNEYMLLYTKEFMLLVVVVIMGIEYSLDLANPTTEAYERWLKENNYRSPLYN